MELLKALDSPDSVDHATAVEFLASYTCLARAHAAQLAEKDLSIAVRCALAPHTDKIREGLIACLQEKAAKTQLTAALVLLNLEDGHARANEILLANTLLRDGEFLSESCRRIGIAHLTSPQAIECLRRLLKHPDKGVRHEAANAVIAMGPSAQGLAPALIAFLETGKDAEGSYQYPWAIALPKSGNLALMALESLKEHARPAVPAILTRFPEAKDEDRLTMLACLANIAPKDDACLALARKSLQNEKPQLKLAAACTLLHVSQGDTEATELLKKAFADGASKYLALEMCERFAPPSREIAGTLMPMLEDKSEEVRIGAMRALGQIGPLAREAVPGIEKLLAKEEDGMTHTFHSCQSAAYALAKIRGKEAAAALLRVADSTGSGAYYAMIYLADLGDDLPPTALAVLVRAIERKGGPKEMAAIALSNLGQRARPVRRDLERLLNDPVAGWILDTALRRIPPNPR
jgi:HEAT repeat protein